LEGSRQVCSEAGIPLAGGHSIDSTEPIFGLAVTGMISIEDLKKNDTAKEGDVLFLTKPLGVGILSTAQKRDLLKPEHLELLTNQMVKLNKVGEALGKIEGVSAMTDITGFGLMGHLIEMAEGSKLSAELYYNKIMMIEGVKEYLAQRIIPDATYRNWNSYSTKVSFGAGVNVMEAFNVLPDPQTNGGLLIAVDPSAEQEVKQVLTQYDLDEFTLPIGRLINRGDKIVNVILNQ
jgi:selenide,water dikinase